MNREDHVDFAPLSPSLCHRISNHLSTSTIPSTPSQTWAHIAMSTRSPTIKRILKEASELTASPSPDFSAAPLESNLFEWHFTLRGPPSPSPFSTGLYHGRIVLPPSYPLRPPSFRFLTPSGRFEVNREICLSISGFHEETWQPAWGVRTALVAIRSFMDQDAAGAIGALAADETVRKRLAAESGGWRCAACGRANDEIMREQEELCRVTGGKEGKAVEVVPEELRLGYREEIEGGAKEAVAETAPAAVAETTGVRRPSALPATMPVRRTNAAPAAAVVAPSPTRPVPQPVGATPLLDRMIALTAMALAFFVLRLMLF